MAKPAKTTMMIAAAPVISRAVEATPWTIAPGVSPVAAQRSWMRLSRNTW